MRPLGESIVAAATAAALGLSPWLLPLIAIAAKPKGEHARKRGLGELLRRWSRGRAGGRAASPLRRQPVMHDRFKAKLEATIWPE
jgi:hypothetical protein